MNGFDLFCELWSLDLKPTIRDDYWWPNSGSFEVVVGTILTQQTKWGNVEKSLANLQNTSLLDLKAIANANEEHLRELIRPSGFYNTKAKRLKNLCTAILKRYGSFENFCEETSREWLLSQKGIGPETADSILCYACRRDVMVVDAYTARVLSKHGVEDLDYDEMQEWLSNSIFENREKAAKLIGDSSASLCRLYALFHGLIVEYSKKLPRKRAK